MALRKQIMRGSAVLFSGQMAGQAFAFVRNIVVARLISPDDFGIAATFAITLSLLEMASDLAADRLLVQAENGDEPRMQGTAQLMLVGRGLISAVVIFLIAQPLAMLFDVPRATWAFQCLAIVPILRGFRHLDLKRMQRTMRFGPSVKVEAVSQAFALMLAWPLALWLRDYSAVLWVTLAQVAISTIASHLVAERRYEWNWERAHAVRMLGFGWPLLVNGLLMYGIFQGDRLIVGAGYSMVDLGIYTAAFTLTMVPTVLLARVNGSLVLPVFAEVQHDRKEFEYRYRCATELLSLNAGAFAVSFILIGGPLLVLLYGSQYAAAVPIVSWLGAMQALRLVRSAPSQAAMALGETKNTMIANVARTFALLPMLWVAYRGLPLSWIAACGVGGEVAAMATAVLLLRWRHGVPVASTLRPISLSIIITVIAGIAVYVGVESHGVIVVGLLACLLIATMLVYAFWRFEVANAAFSRICHTTELAMGKGS